MLSVNVRYTLQTRKSTIIFLPEEIVLVLYLFLIIHKHCLAFILSLYYYSDSLIGGASRMVDYVNRALGATLTFIFF